MRPPWRRRPGSGGGRTTSRPGLDRLGALRARRRGAGRGLARTSPTADAPSLAALAARGADAAGPAARSARARRGVGRASAGDGRGARGPRRQGRRAARRCADPCGRRRTAGRGAAPRRRHLDGGPGGERPADAAAAARDCALLGWAFGFDVPGALLARRSGRRDRARRVLLLAARALEPPAHPAGLRPCRGRAASASSSSRSRCAPGGPPRAALADARARAASGRGSARRGRRRGRSSRLLRVRRALGRPARRAARRRGGPAAPARCSPTPGGRAAALAVRAARSRSARSCCRRSCWPAPCPSGWPSSPPQPSPGERVSRPTARRYPPV